jgi:hypothetical protein
MTVIGKPKKCTADLFAVDGNQQLNTRKTTMPNHVISKVYVNDDDSLIKYDQIKAEVSNNGHDFDFNQLIPEPLEHADDSSSIMPGWYEWRCTHWGTKWNAYEHAELNKGFSFFTAWSAPLPIYYALSRKYPDCVFTVDWADEDIGGDNHGTASFRAGECVQFIQQDGTFACDMWGFECEEDQDDDVDDSELSDGVQMFLATITNEQVNMDKVFITAVHDAINKEVGDA